MSKSNDQAPVEEPLKPIQWDAIRPSAQTDEGAVPFEDRPFTSPKTAKDWGALAKIVKAATLEQYPAVTSEDLAAFKKAVAYATNGMAGMKWSFIGIAPTAFFLITQYLFKAVQWGALFWLIGLVCIFGAQYMGGQAARSAQQEAIALGQRLRLFKK
jgi:hypothetical protein